LPKAKQLIAGASFGPTKVAQLARVFDEAWDLVKAEYQSPMAIEAARLKLANIVINLAKEEEGRDRKGTPVILGAVLDEGPTR
jgi:hypothetical protein